MLYGGVGRDKKSGGHFQSELIQETDGSGMQVVTEDITACVGIDTSRIGNVLQTDSVPEVMVDIGNHLFLNLSHRCDLTYGGIMIGKFFIEKIDDMIETGNDFQITSGRIFMIGLNDFLHKETTLFCLFRIPWKVQIFQRIDFPDRFNEFLLYAGVASENGRLEDGIQSVYVRHGGHTVVVQNTSIDKQKISWLQAQRIIIDAVFVASVIDIDQFEIIVPVGNTGNTVRGIMHILDA